MPKSAVTISLVPEAAGGPFVFWNDLQTHLARAAQIGFDAVEIFAPSPDSVNVPQIKSSLAAHHLHLAGIGTGAGWVVRRLRLTDPNPAVRSRAIEFILGMIDLAGQFPAPVIIGSMLGRWDAAVSRPQALLWLREALDLLAPRASTYHVPLLLEPLNRYESNLLNTVQDGLELVRTLQSKNVKLLCDLFHMNIEETSIPDALRAAGPALGHVHFVDSNRQAAGFGHIDFAPIAAALRQIHYQGYLSAEALPLPTSDHAARQTLNTFHQFFTKVGRSVPRRRG